MKYKLAILSIALVLSHEGFSGERNLLGNPTQSFFSELREFGSRARSIFADSDEVFACKIIGTGPITSPPFALGTSESKTESKHVNAADLDKITKGSVSREPYGIKFVLSNGIARMTIRVFPESIRKKGIVRETFEYYNGEMEIGVFSQSGKAQLICIVP